LIAAPWITILTLIPVAGACVLVSLPDGSARLAKWTAVAFGSVALIVSLGMWHGFDAATAGMQMQERHAWIASLNIEYRLGVDGLGVLMLVLSAIVVLIAIAASWQISERVRLNFALVLLLESCLFGAFTALNFVHWFTFWELSLVPAFFLIKLWGGPRRTAAATQFLVYTMVGSVAMLLSFVALYAGTGTFDFLELATLAHAGQLMPMVLNKMAVTSVSPQHVAMLVFLGAFLGFAVKVPIVPFHTWLPDAYAEAPTGTTILLTGAMSKMGLYGFLRIVLPIFGEQIQGVLTPLLWLAVASVVLSAYAALAQKDMKRIFAYSSINHLGYCMLGIFAVARATGGDAGMLTQKSAAISGVLLQMFNHGITAATIFWFLAMIEARSLGLRGVDDFGGLRKVAPVLAGLMGIAMFSSLGLPGLNGFIGEFLIFKGAFPLTGWATSLCALGLLLTAIFILGVIQRVFSGPLDARWERFRDLSIAERVSVLPVIAMMFVIGLYPQILLGTLHTTVVAIVQQIRQ
jgi:NADH-quinone oxidoreductase subunit M